MNEIDSISSSESSTHITYAHVLKLLFCGERFGFKSLVHPVAHNLTVAGMKLPIPVPLRLLSTSLKPQPVIVYMKGLMVLRLATPQKLEVGACGHVPRIWMDLVQLYLAACRQSSKRCLQGASHVLMQARVQDSSGRNLKHSNTIHQMLNT